MHKYINLKQYPSLGIFKYLQSVAEIGEIHFASRVIVEV